MKERIGFIGLGAMGKPMALCLVKAGYPVTVTWHRNRAPAEELEKTGAKIVPDVISVAAASDVVITILPADPEILEVYRGGLLDGLKKGGTCIEMTSALPSTVKIVEQEALSKGIGLLDAPVSGGVARAAEGSLTIMVGGSKELFDQCHPILQAMGKTIFYTGEVGNGKSVKMINQLLNAGNTLIASEAVYLARRMGLDLELMCKVINESSGGSWIFANNVPKSIIPENFKPGFRLDLMKKDMDLSLEYARQEGIVLPVMDLVSEIYQAMINQGHGGEYYTIVSQWIKQQNRREWQPCTMS